MSPPSVESRNYADEVSSLEYEPISLPLEVVRVAVGRMIGALLHLQIGFMLVTPHREFLAVAIALCPAARFIRRYANISGS